jgi:hypothetical protein
MVDIIHASDWLKFALAGWVLISLLVTPLVGRFLASALRERADETHPLPPREPLGTGQPPQAAALPGLQAGHNAS